MRTVVTLCLLAVLCTVNVDSESDILETLKLQVRSAKWAVDSVMQQLGHLRAQINEDTLLTVTKKWREYIEAHRIYVDLLSTAMRNEVEDAKMKGADAQQCYDINFQGISDTFAQAHENAEKCKKTAKTSIENSFGFIDTLALTGHALVGELDNVILDCHNSDTVIMQNCISIELEKIKIGIKTLEEDAKSAERVVKPMSNYVILQADKCLNDIYTLARLRSEDSKLSCSGCIERALNDMSL